MKSENRFKTYVFPYIYPYFHQDWGMFVPVPKQNFYVYVKHKDSDWQDLVYLVNTAHQENRLSGNESFLLSLTNSLRYYKSSVSAINTIEKDDDSNIYFVVLKKTILQYIFIKSKKKPEDMEIIIRIVSTNNKLDHSHYYKLSID